MGPKRCWVSSHFCSSIRWGYCWGDGLGAVLDLVDLAGTGGRVEHYHVELSNGELQDENLFLGVGQLGFQQYNTSILRQKRRIGCGSWS